LFTFWLAITLSFILLRIAPTDGLTAVLQSSGASEAIISGRISANHLDDPLPVQYAAYLAGLVRGEMGVSLLSGLPVVDLLIPAAGRTLSLAAAAFALAVPAGIGLGAVAAAAPRTPKWLASLFITLVVSVPGFITAYLLLLFVTALLPGARVLGGEAVLAPAIALAVGSAASIAQVSAAAIAELRLAPFLNTARAMGFSESYVLRMHVLPVAATRIIPVISLQALFLLGGTVVTESIFVRPGIGRLLVDYVLRRDYVVVQGVVVWATLCALAVQVITDLLVAAADARVRDA
jgi:peptide/nickel transport system permease protein